MIEPKDASTCDERRVKNKLNPLTHKKKGETRTMSIQSTKHWKLGAFFVISLMLIAGLFSNTASAQSAEITVSPKSDCRAATVLATDIVDLTITYTVTAREIDPGNDRADGTDEQSCQDDISWAPIRREIVNTVVFSLPLGATYPVDAGVRLLS